MNETSQLPATSLSRAARDAGPGVPVPIRLLLLLALAFAVRPSMAAAPDADATTSEEKDGLRVQSAYLNVELSLSRPSLLFLGVDSLGGAKVDHDVLSADTASQAGYAVAHAITASGASVSYSRGSPPLPAAPDWTIEATARGIRFTSHFSPEAKPEALTLSFDTHRCYSTLLGLFDGKDKIALPAVLHLPGFGTLRLTLSLIHI